MSIKRRIWALPIISAVIFGIGIAVRVYFSTTAIKSVKTNESVDYPVLDLQPQRVLQHLASLPHQRPKPVLEMRVKRNGMNFKARFFRIIGAKIYHAGFK